jgi:hypothetical protein
MRLCSNESKQKKPSSAAFQANSNSKLDNGSFATQHAL